MSYCPYCLEKDNRIYDLKVRIKALQAKLKQQERGAKEQPFGSSTPSSKVLIKPNAKEDKRQLRGGGKPGQMCRRRAQRYTRVCASAATEQMGWNRRKFFERNAARIFRHIKLCTISLKYPQD